MNVSLDAALSEATSRFVAANPLSLARHESARGPMPGGNTRTVLHYSPFPLAWAKGEGAMLTDLDGNTYTDFLGEYSAGLYGHSNPKIQAAMHKAIDDGTVLGGPNVYEAELAGLLKNRFPSLQQLRFCNSGTEANVFALMTALAVTGRKKIMVFDGGYHGGVLYFGHGGIPINLPLDWVLAPYNDVEGTLDLIRQHGQDLAAILVEPMLGSGGCLPGRRDFLGALRQAASELGIILIFDEVMTSRLSSGGLQAALGVTPDMTTLGKYLGGGASFGAFGGRADIMAHYDPEKPGYWPHAGTFNNNVLSMAAGLTGLRDIYTPAAAMDLNAKGDRLRDGLNALAQKHEVGMGATGCGSFIGLHFTKDIVDRPMHHADEEEARRGKLHKLMHLDFIAAGLFFARRGYMALSLALTDGDIDRFLGQTEEFILSRRALIG
ncbi:MAG: aminotransferase class III-fold pyridoxal phosphate-dependent enzyme [Rhodospirillaceae bacterium]|nr:aminotransferase class III-fold pyridoxal phosphate-dependent enzyme [Rhodospirillaceae bacterium]